MSNRRNRPPNRFGCKPTEDVCVEHDMPLDCRHGCRKAKKHKCASQQAAPIERPEDHPDYPFGKVQSGSGLDV